MGILHLALGEGTTQNAEVHCFRLSGGLPSLTPRPSLRLRPMPTTATTDTVWATPDTAMATDTDVVWATPDTEATDTVWDTEATTARGPLTPNPPLLLSPRLMPMLTTATTDTVWATPDTATATDTDTVWATPDTEATDTATDTAVDTATTARGLLMPSPLLSPRLMLTTATTDTVWDTPDTDTATDTPDTDTDMDAATDTATA